MSLTFCLCNGRLSTSIHVLHAMFYMMDTYLAGGDDEDDDDTETSHTVLAYSYELLEQIHSHTYSTDKIITGMAQ